MTSNLIFPLIAATVFTAGGYGILRAERYAEYIGDILTGLFVLCASLAVMGTVAIAVEPRHPAHIPQALSRTSPASLGRAGSELPPAAQLMD